MHSFICREAGSCSPSHEGKLYNDHTLSRGDLSGACVQAHRCVLSLPPVQVQTMAFPESDGKQSLFYFFFFFVLFILLSK